MIRTLTFALLLAVSACGGKAKAGPTTTTPGAGGEAAHEHQAGGGEGKQHENLSPEMEAFQELLRPLWHQAKGPPQQADTCAASEQLKASADAVGKATPPIPANADTWTAATKALVAAVADIETACKSKGDIEGALKKVHTAFHALMTQSRPPS